MLENLCFNQAGLKTHIGFILESLAPHAIQKETWLSAQLWCSFSIEDVAPKPEPQASHNWLLPIKHTNTKADETYGCLSLEWLWQCSAHSILKQQTQLHCVHSSVYNLRNLQPHMCGKFKADSKSAGFLSSLPL